MYELDKREHIQLYAERYEDDYQPLEELISDKPIAHKEKIALYMKNAFAMAAVPGILRDAFTGEFMHREWLVHTDDKYYWETDIIYYFEKYNYSLGDEFIEHVLTKLKPI